MASRMTPTPVASSPEERFLTTAEAAAILAVRPSTLVEYRKASAKVHGPQYVRLNSQVVRYRLSDVLAYIAAQESRV